MQDQPERSLIHGAFNSTLRSRPVWKVLEPVLTASEMTLQECHLQGYDFSFPLYGQDTQYLHVLLVTPSCLDPLCRSTTISRLEQLSISTQRQIAIGFLTSEKPFSNASGKCNLDGLFALQVLMSESLPTLIPVIPIPDSSCFFVSIREYIANLVVLPSCMPNQSDSVSLLASITKSVSSHEFSEVERDLLSELFPSLCALSKAARTSQGRAILEEHFGDKVAKTVSEFWYTDCVREN